MPRPKSYDRDEAIVRARDAFWQHGYRALGVRELGSLAGINRFALNTDFGGKENLFLEAVDAYFAEANQYFIEPIREGDVRDLLDAVAALAKGDKGSPRVFGCLMVNTMIESAGQHEGEIAKKVERHFQSIRRAVKTNVATSRKRGLLGVEITHKSAADYVIGVVIAANSLNRAARSLRGCEGFVTQACLHIRSWLTAPR